MLFNVAIVCQLNHALATTIGINIRRNQIELEAET